MSLHDDVALACENAEAWNCTVMDDHGNVGVPVSTLRAILARHPAPPVSESETADCATCKIPDPMMPSHNPSPYCESGKRPHCTCDRCY